jgi:hypothetical protein
MPHSDQDDAEAGRPRSARPSPVAAQFYIVQEPGTNRCTITEQPAAPDVGPSNPLPTILPYPTPPQTPSQPDEPTSTVVVGDGAYGDRTTAEADLSTIAACTGQ